MAPTVQHPPADPSLATLLREIRAAVGNDPAWAAKMARFGDLMYWRGVQAEQRRARAQQQA